MESRRVFDVGKLVEEYIEEKTWLVRENANSMKSFSGLISYIALEALKGYASIVYSDILKYHYDGTIHFHDLPYSAFVPYCVGWSLDRILRIGLITPRVRDTPADSFFKALNHIENFLMLAQQEWSGAQALNKVDLYLAAFVNSDKVSYRDLNTGIERLIYNLNFPSRIGAQTPFTNFTFLLDTVPEVLDDPAIVNGSERGYLGDYVEEAISIVKSFTEIFIRGDSANQPFTFPIPTIMLTRNFDWNERKWGDLTYNIFKAATKRGSFYFLNGLSGVIDPAASYAMCCRLTIDKRRLLVSLHKISILSESTRRDLLKVIEEYGETVRKIRCRGLWAYPDETGSIGVVTLNMPRLGFLSKGDENILLDKLNDVLNVARNILLKKRRRLEAILRGELMLDLPITKVYLGTLNYHFNTIGVIGLPEFMANFTRNPLLWRDLSRRDIRNAIDIVKKVAKYIGDVISEFEKEDNTPYNLEEVPGEGASYRLASIDYKLFKEYVEKGEYFIPLYDGVPFYSNSIIPYYANVSLWDRILWEAEVQQMFTGGVMTHIFLGEEAEPEALKKLVHNIAVNTKIVYFSITPTLTVCNSCRWCGIGVYTVCPKCNSRKVDIWSRIVGYYRPLSRWNPGKIAEFKSRIHYKV